MQGALAHRTYRGETATQWRARQQPVRPDVLVQLSRDGGRVRYGSGSRIAVARSSPEQRRNLQDSMAVEAPQAQASEEVGEVDQLETDLLRRDSYGLLDMRPYTQTWNVPWTLDEVGITFLLWIGAFMVTNFVLPGMLVKEEWMKSLMTTEWRSVVILAQQLLLTVAGNGVVRYGLRKHLAYADRVVFTYRLRPAYGNNGWVTWASYGLTAGVVAVVLYTFLAQYTGLAELFRGKGYRTMEGMSRIMQPMFGSYFCTCVTTTILAPVVEEIFFRGFLLTSLASFMPPWQAVLLQAAVFGASHLTIQDFSQLTMLGVIIGFCFLRTKNLLCPMLIHAMWNFGSTSVIYYLMQRGELDALLDMF